MTALATVAVTSASTGGDGGCLWDNDITPNGFNARTISPGANWHHAFKITGVGPPDCPGDLDDDGDVDLQDLLQLLVLLGTLCEDCLEDLDGDGAIDFDDLLLMLRAWGPCP